MSVHLPVIILAVGLDACEEVVSRDAPVEVFVEVVHLRAFPALECDQLIGSAALEIPT